jgi:hypothetical protein
MGPTTEEGSKQHNSTNFDGPIRPYPMKEHSKKPTSEKNPNLALSKDQSMQMPSQEWNLYNVDQCTQMPSQQLDPMNQTDDTKLTPTMGAEHSEHVQYDTNREEQQPNPNQTTVPQTQIRDLVYEEKYKRTPKSNPTHNKRENPLVLTLRGSSPCSSHNRIQTPNDVDLNLNLTPHKKQDVQKPSHEWNSYNINQGTQTSSQQVNPVTQTDNASPTLTVIVRHSEHTLRYLINEYTRLTI